MEIIQRPPILSFISDGMIFKVKSTKPVSATVINVNQEVVFTASAYPSAYGIVEFDLTSIINDISKEVNPTNDDVLVGLFSTNYQIVFDLGTDHQDAVSGRAYKGGLPYYVLNELAAQGLTPFTYRFLNKNANFIFSNRTDRQHIRIYRSELGHIYFLSQSYDKMSICTADKEYQLLFKYDDGTISDKIAAGSNICVNLASIAQQLGNPSYMWMTIGGGKKLSWEIEDSSHEDSCLLYFRNSFGFFEKILISGEGKRKITFNNTQVQRLNEHGRLYTTNKKSKYKEIINVSSGYKMSNNLLLLIDVVQSDEVYFFDGVSVRRCHVSCSDFTTQLRSTTPQQVDLTIEFSEQELNFAQYSGSNVLDLLISERNQLLMTNNNKYIEI